MDRYDEIGDNRPLPEENPAAVSAQGRHARAIERRGDLLQAEEAMHVCPACSSPLVQPVDSAPIDMRRWRVELRCPECRLQSADVYPREALDRFDEVLDDATESLIDDLRRLERENIEDEVRSLARALNSGLLLPEDF